MSFILNGVVKPSWLLVNSIDTSIMPNITQKTEKVPKRAGMYDFGNEIAERKFNIDITIVATDSADLKSKIRLLQDYLYYENPVPFVLDDEPGITYFVKLSGDSNTKDTLRIGQGSITLVAYDPYGYGTESTINFTSGSATVDYTTQVFTTPVMEFTFTGNTTEFLLLKDNDYIYLGQPSGATVGTPSQTLILDDDCSSIATYTAGLPALIDGGIIGGDIASNGISFIQSSNNYGTGLAWHGGARVKSLGTALTNFTFEIDIGFLSNVNAQLGRIEAVGIDTNNNSIFKIAIRDSGANNTNPYLEARAGTPATGYPYVNYYGKVDRWKNYTGTLRVQRINNRWKFWAIKKSGNTIIDTFTNTFYDANNIASNDLAGFQIHLGAYGTFAPYTTARIDHIRVYREETIPNTQVPYIFIAGDVLTIDHGKGTVLKNGEPFYTALEPSSKFLKITKGTNTFSAEPQIYTGILKYTTRWR